MPWDLLGWSSPVKDLLFIGFALSLQSVIVKLWPVLRGACWPPVFPSRDRQTHRRPGTRRRIRKRGMMRRRTEGEEEEEEGQEEEEEEDDEDYHEKRR